MLNDASLRKLDASLRRLGLLAAVNQPRNGKRAALGAESGPAVVPVGYLREAVNACQASAVNASVPPARLVVSRTRFASRVRAKSAS